MDTREACILQQSSEWNGWEYGKYDLRRASEFDVRLVTGIRVLDHYRLRSNRVCRLDTLARASAPRSRRTNEDTRTIPVQSQRLPSRLVTVAECFLSVVPDDCQHISVLFHLYDNRFP